jgi:hypothetical protein
MAANLRGNVVGFRPNGGRRKTFAVGLRETRPGAKYKHNGREMSAQICRREI